MDVVDDDNDYLLNDTALVFCFQNVVTLKVKKF